MNIGILGAGQLARMLALAAHPLAIRTVCIDPAPDACAKPVTEVITAELIDQAALQRLVETVDLVTYETENIPLATAEWVAKSRPLYPSVETLGIAQDRLHEKTFFQSLQIPTAAFAAVNSQLDLNAAVNQLGLPAILKTRRMGYDGKGQIIIRAQPELEQAYAALNKTALILEAFVQFECEVSLISVRNQQGEIRFYPLVRNQHVNGILRSSEAPFLHPVLHPALQKQAEAYATRVLEKLNYIGVLTIEFFYDGNQLIANEMAPRVHNSGHWTIEGAQTSQFENHLRAILNWPLGATGAIGHCRMLNCIGEMPAPAEYLATPGAHYHNYGKIPRPGRKLGHITIVDSSL